MHRARAAATSPLRRAGVSFVGAALLLAASPAAIPAVPASAAGPSRGARPTASPAPLAASPAPAGPADDTTLLVGVDPGASPGQRAGVVRAVQATSPQMLAPDVVKVTVPPSELPAKEAALRATPGVRFVQRNNRVHADVTTPNDPRWVDASLWALQNNASPGISAPAAWSTTTGSSSVVVGVLDTGIDDTHPDLAPNMWANPGTIGGCGSGTHGYDFVHGNCFPQDDNTVRYNAATQQCDIVTNTYHGTHVSGTIGAAGNNALGVVGVNWHVSLMGLKMLDACGSGDDVGAVSAINWAIAAKNAGINLRVLNASWGGQGSDPVIANAVQAAGNAGILFVAAAGNNNANNDNPAVAEYPCAAHLANELCVAATTQSDVLAGFSNYGAVTVDLGAPGTSILSTKGGGTWAYQYLQGTSMATPHVTGAAALALAAQPSLTVDALRAQLVNGVDVLPSLTGKVVSGGRLNLCKAILACVVPPTPPTLVHVSLSGGGGATATVRWSPPLSNGGAALGLYTITADHGATPASQQLAGTTATVTGLLTGVTTYFTVIASNSAGSSPPAAARALVLGGGLEIDGWGGLHFFSTTSAGTPVPLPLVGAPYWSGWDIARGVAITPDGTGGYVLDGWGGLHPFGLAGNPPPPAAVGNPYWSGWNIARGVALTPDGTGGYVLDGYGGVHPFALPGFPAPAPAVGNPYWYGWDIARGITLVRGGGGGGYVVDGWGGLHGFTTSTGSAPGVAAGDAPYWYGWSIARGGNVLTNGVGGYVVDGWGGLHTFNTNAGPVPVPPALTGAPYWAGWDIVRGVSL